MNDQCCSASETAFLSTCHGGRLVPLQVYVDVHPLMKQSPQVSVEWARYLLTVLLGSGAKQNTKGQGLKPQDSLSPAWEPGSPRSGAGRPLLAVSSLWESEPSVPSSSCGDTSPGGQKSPCERTCDKPLSPGPAASRVPAACTPSLGGQFSPPFPVGELAFPRASR